MHRVATHVEVAEALAAASRTSVAYTTGIDLTNYHGELDHLISAGTFGASATLDAKYQESDDDVTYTDCSGADAIGNAASITQMTAAGSVHLKRGVRAFTKRYARVAVTPATEAVVCSVTRAAFKNKPS